MAQAVNEQPTACYGLACPQRGTCERFSALGLTDGAVIDSCQTREGWPMYLPTRSAALRDAGFTPRDRRLACDECGRLFTVQMLPVHRCAA